MTKDQKTTTATVASARKSGIGHKLAFSPAEWQAHKDATNAAQAARLARIAERSRNKNG